MRRNVLLLHAAEMSLGLPPFQCKTDLSRYKVLTSVILSMLFKKLHSLQIVVQRDHVGNAAEKFHYFPPTYNGEENHDL